MDKSVTEISQRCMACNGVISDLMKSCTCGHVNEALRTIAGKRFSGYREELYTRRVIKESRDEYRRMKRESLGIKSRQRKSVKPGKLHLRKRKRQNDVCLTNSETCKQLNCEVDYDNPTDETPYNNGKNIHPQGITDDGTNEATTHEVASVRDNMENSVYVDGSIGYEKELPSVESYVIQQNRQQYISKTKTIPCKRGPKNTSVNHYNRKTGPVSCREDKTRTIRPIKQFAIAGPLAEINKRLMNQSGFWMCLGDSLGFGKPATSAATDIVLADVL